MNASDYLPKIQPLTEEEIAEFRASKTPIKEEYFKNLKKVENDAKFGSNSTRLDEEKAKDA